MAKKVVRKNEGSVSLMQAGDGPETLVYTLKVKGARANFGWADDKPTTILTHNNFGLDDEVTWSLKVESAPNGKIKVTCPENPAYSRVEQRGKAPSYVLTLAFVTAVGYTLTVQRCDKDGNAIGEATTDIDLTMEIQGESVNEGLFVGLG